MNLISKIKHLVLLLFTNQNSLLKIFFENISHCLFQGMLMGACIWQHYAIVTNVSMPGGPLFVINPLLSEVLGEMANVI